MLSLLLLACGPSSVTVGTHDSSPPVDSAPVDTGDPAPRDTGVEHIDDNPEPEETAVRLSPPGGTFVDSVVVTLTLLDGEEAHYTLDGSVPDGRSTPYTGPITLDESAELRVVVTGTGGDFVHGATSYVALDGDAEEVSSNLPLVVLWSDRTLPSDDRYVDIVLQVHDVGSDGRARLLGDATTLSRAALKVRGSSTAYDPKHSYALETRRPESDDDDKVALLDMPKDSDWVLYAPLGFDRALMRNALMYRLSNDMGRYAPRTRFVEVYAAGRGEDIGTGEYLGVYVLIEKITRSDERVAVTPLTPDDTAPPEVTGGYLFKRDRVGVDEYGFWDGTAGGAFSFADPLVYVDPQEQELASEQAAYLSEAVNAFADALVAPDGVSPQDGRHWREHIDVDAWIDHHILNTFAKNPDALRLSAYMYKDREGPIVAGPIWDFDRAMYPEDDDRAQNPTWWDATNQTWDTTDMFEYGWFRALFDSPEFTDAYWARWRVVLGDTLSVDHVDAVIAEMEAELAEAAPRNYARWSGYAPRGGSLESEVDLLEGWLEQRHSWISACLELPDPEQCTGG